MDLGEEKMTPDQRIFILKDRGRKKGFKKGYTQALIAEKEEVTLGAVNNLIHDRPRTKSKKLCFIISHKYMGLPLHIVWPNWFTKNDHDYCISTLLNVPNELICVNGKP